MLRAAIFCATTGRRSTPGPVLPSFSAGSFLAAPEGRLGVCAWALRGFNGSEQTPAAPAKGADDQKESFP